MVSADIPRTQLLRSRASTGPRGRRSFTLLWGGESVSLLGTQITLVALPLTAVTELHASPAVMGLLSAVGWAPIILFALLAGVWTDHADQRRVMLACNGVRVVLIGLIPLLAALGHLTVVALLLVAFAAGTCGTVFDIAYQTFVPSLVDEADLARANSRLEISRSVAQLVGPALAGFLVAQITAAGALSADAASFAVAVVALLFLPVARRTAGDPPVTAARAIETDGHSGACRGQVRVGASLAESIRFVRRSRLLVLLIIVGSGSNLFAAAVVALQTLFAIRVLGMSSWHLGLTFAAEGGAALFSAALLPRIANLLGDARTILLGTTCSLLSVASIAAAHLAAGTLLFGLGQAFSGLSLPLINIPLVTVRQRITPRELLARVNAVVRMCIMAALPVGSLLAGGVAGTIGTPATLWAAAAGLAVVWGLTFRPLASLAPTPTPT
jgi:Na+/melibiose symporter-like transporter